MTYASHHGLPNYVEMFFTQLSQRLDEGIPKYWVTPLSVATQVEEPENQYRNTLHFEVSDEQLPGYIEVKSLSAGRLKLDASCGMPINTRTGWYERDVKEPRIDASKQRVWNYTFKVNTPILSPHAEGTYDYGNRSTTWHYPHALGFNRVSLQEEEQRRLTVDRTETIDTSHISDARRLVLRGSVDLTTLYYRSGQVEEVPYYLNHFWFENVDRHEPRVASLDGEWSWRVLTVDRSDFRLDRVNYQYTPGEFGTTLPGLVSSQIYYTTDRGEHRFYDTGWHARVGTNVNLENVPNTDFSIAMYGNGQGLLSETRQPLPGRGHLPASQFGDATAMAWCDIEDTAYGLIALLAQERYGLVTSVLQELVYYWATVLKNVTADGELNPNGQGVLPDQFRRDYTAASTTRSGYKVAWLGYALCLVCERLGERYAKQYNPPAGLDLLLKQHALFVAYLVDTATGWTFSGYDDSFISGEYDYRSTAIGHLFLNKYLSLSYDRLVHQRSTRMHLRLHQEISPVVLENHSTVQDRYADYALGLFYLYSYKNEAGYLERGKQLIKELSDLNQNERTNEKSIYLVAYICKHWTELELDEELTRLWAIENGSAKLAERLYASWQNRLVPSLKATAWNIISDTFKIEGLPLFFDYFREARAFTDYCYIVAQNLWPFGYRWDSLRAGQAFGSVLGALIFSMGETSYGLYLDYAMLRDGLDLTQAQGWILSEWANSFMIPRPLLVPDAVWREKVLHKFKLKTATPEGFKEYLSLFVDKFKLVESNIPKTYYLQRQTETGITVYEEQTWAEQAHQFDELAQYNPPSLFLAPDTEPVPVSTFLPKITATTYGSYKEAALRAADVTPAGVELNVISLVEVEDFSSADAYYEMSHVDWGQLLSVQEVEASATLTEPFGLARDDDFAEIDTSTRLDTNLVRLVYLNPATVAYLEDESPITAGPTGALLVVPVGVPINFGTIAVAGAVIIPNTAVASNYFGLVPIMLYSRDGNALQLSPANSTIVVV